MVQLKGNTDGEPSTALIRIRILAWLLIVLGSLYIIGVGVTLIQRRGPLHLDLLVAVLPFAGVGLLKGKSGWRTFLLFPCWFVFISIPLILVLSFVAPQLVNLDFGTVHTTVAHAPLPAILSYALTLVLFVFIHRTLTRPNVRAYFRAELPVDESGVTAAESRVGRTAAGGRDRS
jgi:hypothetical protein